MALGRAAVVVWGAWVATSVAVLAYTARFSSDMPLWDEDQYVPVLAGEKPASLAWFFERHADHVIPIPKAIYLATAMPFRDFRTPAICGALMLVAAAAIVLLAIRHVRGRTHWSEVIIPLTTLHWGQAGNLLFGAQVQVMASTLLQATAFALMLRPSGVPTGRTLVAFAACLLALPFCGGQGLALVPALALWPLWLAWKETGPARSRLIAAGALPMLVSVAMIVFHRPAFETTTDPARVGRTALQFIGMAAGPIGGYGWPGTALHEDSPPVMSWLMCSLLVLDAVGVLLPAARSSDDRPRARVLLLHIAALVTLAVSIGVGRGASDPLAGVQNRYVTMALPLFWIVTFAVERFEKSVVRRRFVLIGLLVLAAGQFVFDVQAGLIHGRARSSQAEAAMTALRSGEPRAAIADRFVPFLHPDRAFLLTEFDMLERAHLGPFREPGAR